MAKLMQNGCFSAINPTNSPVIVSSLTEDIIEGKSYSAHTHDEVEKGLRAWGIIIEIVHYEPLAVMML